MCNRLRWVCIFAVIVALANSARPVCGDVPGFTAWYWHTYSDNTDSAQGRTVWERRLCNCWECEDGSFELQAYTQVTEAGSEHIGSWSAGSSGDMGEAEESPPATGSTGSWYASCYARADLSGNACADAESFALVLVTVNGSTVYWEILDIEIDNDYGSSVSEVTFSIHGIPDYGRTGDATEEEDSIGGSWGFTPGLGIELTGWVTTWCYIFDENATSNCYADIIDCEAKLAN